MCFSLYSTSDYCVAICQVIERLSIFSTSLITVTREFDNRAGMIKTVETCFTPISQQLLLNRTVNIDAIPPSNMS